MRIEYEDEAPVQTVHQPREEIKLSNVNVLEEKKKQLWDKMIKKTQQPEEEEIITKADVEKPKPEHEPKPLPDRALVVPELRQLLASKQEQKNPIEEQANRIEKALQMISSPPQEQTFEDTVLGKLEALEARMLRREAEELQRQQEQEFEAKVSKAREKFISHLNDNQDKFPGIVGLGRQEHVFNQIFNLAQQDVEFSEEQLLSQFEAGLRSDYEKLQSIYKTSKARKPSDTPKTTNAIEESTPAPAETGQIHSLKDAQAALWNRLQNSV